tara:strand:- start:148 stop:3399 length:3252 start_codon:yes stop_codon:yes gene_type:complete
MSISQPGVTVTQKFVTESTVTSSPSLLPCVVGPCYQVVDAITSGVLNDKALAGTYRAGKGVMSFAIPGIKTGAILDNTSVKVVIDQTTVTTSLANSDNEVARASGTNDGTLTSLTATTAKFTGGSTDFDQISFAVSTPNDYRSVIRISYQGIEKDLPVHSVSGTELILIIDEADELSGVDLASHSWTAYEQAAQFAIVSESQSVYNFGPGSNANYLKISAKDGGDFEGSKGDNITLSVDTGCVAFGQTSTADKASVTQGYGDGWLVIADSGVFTPASWSTVYDQYSTAGQAAYTQGLIYDTENANNAHRAWGFIEKEISPYALGLSEVLAGYNAGSTLDAAAKSIPGYFIRKDVSINATIDSGDDVADLEGEASLTSEEKADMLLNGGVVYLVDNAGRVARGIFDTNGKWTQGGNNDLIPQGAAVITQIFHATSGKTSANCQFGPAGNNHYFASTNLNVNVVNSTHRLRVGGTAYNISSVTDIATRKWMQISASPTHSTTGGLDFVCVPTTRTALFDQTLSSDGTSTTILFTVGYAAGVPSTLEDLHNAITDSTDTLYKADIGAIITSSKEGAGHAADYSLADDIFSTSAVNFQLDGGSDDKSILIDANVLGAGTTQPMNVYVGYRALRVDVSDQASSPELLKFGSTSAMIESIGPVDKRNPLGLAAYMAIVNSPGVDVACLGVSEVSTTQPMGTTAAWASALEFLESRNIYALAPLTQDTAVLATVDAHVDKMSLAANKSERICFINRPFPGYSNATLVASGTNGSTEANFASTMLFTTSANLDTVHATYDLTSGDYVLVLNDYNSSDYGTTEVFGAATQIYGLKRASHTTYTLTFDNTGFSALTGKAQWEQAQTGLSWRLYKVGTAISSRADQATAASGFGAHYGSKRTFLVWPPKAYSVINGIEESVEGYFLCAAIAGMVGYQGVGQGFTNLNVQGFSKLTYSSQYFSRAQLDAIAGGGTFIVYQETPSSALRIRHQLSTDVSSIEKRELSITKAVDYCSKILRLNIKSKIGSLNITDEMMANVGSLIQGLMMRLMEQSIVRSGSLDSIEIDSSNPDTLNVVVSLSPLYPCNYIKITLQV